MRHPRDRLELQHVPLIETEIPGLVVGGFGVVSQRRSKDFRLAERLGPGVAGLHLPVAVKPFDDLQLVSVELGAVEVAHAKHLVESAAHRVEVRGIVGTAHRADVQGEIAPDLATRQRGHFPEPIRLPLAHLLRADTDHLVGLGAGEVIDVHVLEQIDRAPVNVGDARGPFGRQLPLEADAELVGVGGAHVAIHLPDRRRGGRLGDRAWLDAVAHHVGLKGEAQRVGPDLRGDRGEEQTIVEPAPVAEDARLAVGPRVPRDAEARREVVVHDLEVARLPAGVAGEVSEQSLSIGAGLHVHEPAVVHVQRRDRRRGAVGPQTVAQARGWQAVVHAAGATVRVAQRNVALGSRCRAHLFPQGD